MSVYPWEAWCPPGVLLTFHAKVFVGGTEVVTDVGWIADRGTVNGWGNYFAPYKTGPDTITVILASDYGISATALVHVVPGAQMTVTAVLPNGPVFPAGVPQPVSFLIVDEWGNPLPEWTNVTLGLPAELTYSGGELVGLKAGGFTTVMTVALPGPVVTGTFGVTVTAPTPTITPTPTPSPTPTRTPTATPTATATPVPPPAYKFFLPLIRR
ncbi:MAG: hypothetical protein WC775_01200 [Patescibacteria group bacterium]|jgi:hypothetical protein